MGCGASRVSCPRCSKNTFTNGHQLVQHLKQHHAFGSIIAPVHSPEPVVVTLNCKVCGMNILVDQLANHLQSFHIKPPPSIVQLITCPTCGRNDLPNGQIFLEHLKMYHGFIDQLKDLVPTVKYEVCQNCGAKMLMGEMADHLQKMHIDCAEKDFSCPKCTKNDIKDGEDFLNHLKNAHAFAAVTKMEDIPVTNDPTRGQKKLPKVGDKVLAMWSKSKWQYFHATIAKFIAESLRYEIDWDDGDTTGRVVDYCNIAVDKIPGEMEIGIGSIILFPQGSYTAGDTQLTGGKRWHQGQITNIYTENKKKYYDGVHTKGQSDAKFVTYKGYSLTFTGYAREDFRVGPNVFNILDDNAGEESVSADDIDIYFSCTHPDGSSDNAFSPHSTVNDTYNPLHLSERLKEKGLKVVAGDDGTARNNLMQKVNMMKNCKVFIACICDDYVSNEQCRMEFQYAKSTLRKPVVPVVIGNSTEWTMSVVGMLVAGELYIHFKDKTVEEQKLQEVLRSLAIHISKLTDEVKQEESKNMKIGPGDVFISYCWSNSWDAKENNQINRHTGTQYSDPRSISRKIFDLGYKTWLDIERLKSADQNAGLYEQLTEALKQAKLVVPCISDEYAASANCQMEFKFAVNSLRKQVLPIIVGTGNDWEKTVIGALLTSNNMAPINFQLTGNETDFKSKFNLLIEKIKKVLEDQPKAHSEEEAKPETAICKSRAPKVGDHVVSHHFNYCYYMAVVVSFNRKTMHYTVAWDDGDKSGTLQPFNQVAVDVAPKEDEIGVGSTIFFPQGEYSGTEGSNEGGVRYHEGIITAISREKNILVDGHHTRGPEDRKRCKYRAYSHEFYDIPIYHLRLAPTALESFGM